MGFTPFLTSSKTVRSRLNLTLTEGFYATFTFVKFPKIATMISYVKYVSSQNSKFLKSCQTMYVLSGSTLLSIKKNPRWSFNEIIIVNFSKLVRLSWNLVLQFLIIVLTSPELKLIDLEMWGIALHSLRFTLNSLVLKFKVYDFLNGSTSVFLLREHPS